MGLGFSARFDCCYRCGKKISFFETTCSSCGTNNIGLKLFYYLSRICLLVILILFFLSLAPGFMFFLLDIKILPPSVGSFINSLAAFSMQDSSVLFSYLVFAFLSIFLLAIIGTFYQAKLKKDIQAQAGSEIIPEKLAPVIPGLPQVKDASLDGIAKALFSPGQYKIFKFVLIAFVIAIIVTVLSAAVPFLLPVAQYQGLSVLFILLAAISGFMAPILFVLAIVLFILFIYKNAKIQALKNPPKQDRK